MLSGLGIVQRLLRPTGGREGGSADYQSFGLVGCGDDHCALLGLLRLIGGVLKVVLCCLGGVHNLFRLCVPQPQGLFQSRPLPVRRHCLLLGVDNHPIEVILLPVILDELRQLCPVCDGVRLLLERRCPLAPYGKGACDCQQQAKHLLPSLFHVFLLFCRNLFCGLLYHTITCPFLQMQHLYLAYYGILCYICINMFYWTGGSYAVHRHHISCVDLSSPLPSPPHRHDRGHLSGAGRDLLRPAGRSAAAPARPLEWAPLPL